MQKERFGSFMHRVGCSIILSMFYVTIVDILVNIIIVIANILPKIDNMPAIMQLVLENEIWNLIQLDILEGKPFSILFTATFMVSFVFMMLGTLDEYIKSRNTSKGIIIAYIIVFLLYFVINKIAFVPKILIFALALMAAVVFEITESSKNKIKLWTSMDRIPKYRTANAFSIAVLLLSTVAVLLLVGIVVFALSKFLEYFCNVLYFPSILKLIIIKSIEVIGYLAMLNAWIYMGNIHDSIIAKYYEDGSIRY